MSGKNDAFAAYKLLRDEFEKRNYSSKEVIKNDKLFIHLTSPSGRVWEFKSAPIKYPFTSDTVIELCSKKELAYDFANKNNVSIPFTHYVQENQSLDDKVLQNIINEHAPLIVKPSNASSSKGLTLDVMTLNGLKTAIQYARSFKQNILIQQQVQGEEIRFIVLEGKVVAALLRQNALVVGDGVSSIAELVKKENVERENLVFPYISYPQLTDAMISGSYFTDSRIPAKGETVKLNKATMIKEGCSVYDILGKVHPSYIKQVESTSALLDAGLLAVDIFIHDYKQPISVKNYSLIEFNTFPSLKFCYGCRDGKMFDIVPLLVDAIDTHLHAA